MRTSSIGEIRRAELSAAAFQAVVIYGVRRTTLEKVGNIAGVSKGVVLHYFKDKSALLAAVFRRSNSLLSEAVVELYRHAKTPYERLWAIIVANFFETIFNRSVCQAWAALVSEVAHNEQCQRIQAANNTRIRSNLQHELKHLLNQEEIDSAARHLGLLIDGIWVRSGSIAEIIDSQKAISEMAYAIKKLLPNDPDSAEKHKKARAKMEDIADIALTSNAFKSKFIQIQIES
ncbi:MAG: transcriptional regulator BetI [Paracoccaceae bacterium]|jgi:TetR/AcrR family transcriptional repressor of bet genes